MQHVVRLLVEERLVDLGEIAGLQRIERRGEGQEGPEVGQQLAVLHQGVVDGPVLGRQDLGGDVSIAVALLLDLVLVSAVAGGPRRRARAAKRQAQRPALLGGIVVAVVAVVGRVLDRLERGGDDVVEQLGEDVVLAQVLEKLGVVLLELLDQVTLVQQVLEEEVGLVEDGIDGGDVGVAAKPPKHGDSGRGAGSRVGLDDATSNPGRAG